MIFMSFLGADRAGRIAPGTCHRYLSLVTNTFSIFTMLQRLTPSAPLSAPSRHHASREPFDAGLLDVGQGHRVYVEQWGNPAGLPVVFLHGGPGSACSPRHRSFFDPHTFRAIFLDQRACGRSLAPPGWAHNTTPHLIADLETLRQHLGLARWLVMGGSWGAGLGLGYASAHPEACLGLLLRGVFLGRPCDIDGFFQGMRQRLPQAWDALTRGATRAEQSRIVAWLHQQLHHGSEAQALAIAVRWQAWETSVEQRQTVPAPATPLPPQEAQRLVRKYQVQSHYLLNGCFWGEAGLLSRIHTLHRLPVALVHGQCDTVCSPQAGLEVHRRLPHSTLYLLAQSGHNPFEPAMAQAVVNALNGFALHGHFGRCDLPTSTSAAP